MYHIDIRSTNSGSTVASRAPRKKRLVATPPKDIHAGVQMRIIPYAMVARERNFRLRDVGEVRGELEYEVAEIEY